MPPSLASLLTTGFALWLFRRDIREKPNVTGAVWIPFLWLIIMMTRAVSEWFATFGFDIGGVSLEEGSPVDAIVYLALIIAGMRVMARRQVHLAEIVRHNRWLAIFFIYCFLSILWSDFPFVAFKRWFKVIGHPVMVLILLTEPDFEAALTTLLKRLAYVIIPVSVLFIKYYPALGRGYSEWTGGVSYCGITLGKNALGVDCLILGFFFFWYLLKLRTTEKSKFRRNEMLLCLAALFGIWWLLSMAKSSTSLVSLLVGVFILLVLGLRMIRKEYVGMYFVAAIVFCAIAQFGFGASDLIIRVLGKDPTLTDRTDVWHDCLQIPINPILGAGFESWWLGDRLRIMWTKWYWHPNEAHNGYLETYLNLGLVGLFILVALIIATFWKGRRELLANFHFGRFRIAFLTAVVIYNGTEASFKALHPMWFFFYVIALDYPRPPLQSAPAEVEIVADDLAVADQSAEAPRRF